MEKFMKMKKKLVIIITALNIVGMAGLAASTLVLSRQQISARANEAANNAAAEAAGKINNYTNIYMNAAENNTSLPEIQKILSEIVVFGAHVDAAVHSPEGVVASNYAEQRSGKSMRTFNVPLAIEKINTQWTLTMNVPERLIFAPLYQMLFIDILIIIVMLLITSGAAIIVSRSISKPIAYTISILKDVAVGDLTKTVEIKSDDEIGELAGYLNFTISNIKKLIYTIKYEANALSRIGEDLSGNMNNTASAINEITGNIDSIQGQVANQGDGVDETNDAMNNIISGIKSLTGQVENQTECVSRSSAAVEQMLANIQSVTQTLLKNADNVNNLANASEVGRSGLQEVSEDIKTISEESEGLLQINAVMQNIASQTNLLSMNAAIEAAHAGTTGQGFAVVADEIRKLAENSGKQSKTISSVLKKIKDSIDKISKSTNDVLQKFEAISDDIRTVSDQETNIRNAMEEQSAGSQNVLEAISELQNITGLVKSGSVQMHTGSSVVINQMENLSNITLQITDGVKEMSVGANQINTSVVHVNDISSDNKRQIGVLMKEVEKFKVDDGSGKENTVNSIEPVHSKEDIFQYPWSDSYSVYNEFIDSQHKVLFGKINELLAAMQEGKGKQELKKAMDFLQDYVIKHFFEEEQLQKASNYPGYNVHHNLHEGFKVTVKRISHDLILKGASDELLGRVKKQIAEWLISHIKTEDTKIGAHLRKR
jgi:hemerythrin-like metal-binding protein